MKKLLAIIVLGLLWSNVSFSDVALLKCKGKTVNSITDGKKTTKSIPYFSIFKINLKDNFFTRDDAEDIKENFISSGDQILWYEVGPSFGGGFSASYSALSRVSGEYNFKRISFNESVYNTLKKDLDKINKKIKGYKPNLEWGDESYGVSKQGLDIQELEKFKIIKQFYTNKKLVLSSSEAEWICEKKEKLF